MTSLLNLLKQEDTCMNNITAHQELMAKAILFVENNQDNKHIAETAKNVFAEQEKRIVSETNKLKDVQREIADYIRDLVYNNPEEEHPL